MKIRLRHLGLAALAGSAGTVSITHLHELPAYLGTKLVAWGGFHLVRKFKGLCTAHRLRRITEKFGLDFGYHGEEEGPSCEVPSQAKSAAS